MNSTDDSSEIELLDVRFGEGGLLYRFARAIGLLPGRGGVVRVGIAIALLTWFPLLVVSAIEGTLLSGPTIAFRQSFGTHTRLLVAIPLFFWAESLFTGRISDVLQTMLDAQLVRPEDLPRFGRACRQARRWWESQAVEAVFMVLAAVAIYAGLRADISAGVGTWRTKADGRLSLAGWWYSVMSLPFFQFLLWRWFWRLLVWARLLWKISRLNLALVPTHPDRAGGLGSLGVAHVDLAPLGLAASAVLAANFAEEIMFGGKAVGQVAAPAVAMILGSTLAWIAPLFVFSRRLLELRQRGLLDYGALATTYTRDFDTKWLRGGAPPGEPFLGSADLQSLADLGNSFGVISEIRIAPIGQSQLLMLAVAAALPLLPLVLFAFPLNELILRGLKSLVGV